METERWQSQEDHGDIINSPSSQGFGFWACPNSEDASSRCTNGFLSVFSGSSSLYRQAGDQSPNLNLLGWESRSVSAQRLRADENGRKVIFMASGCASPAGAGAWFAADLQQVSQKQPLARTVRKLWPHRVKLMWKTSSSWSQRLTCYHTVSGFSFTNPTLECHYVVCFLLFTLLGFCHPALS